MLDLATLHRRASRILPEQLKTCGIVIDNADATVIAALLLPLRHRHRGALFFRLAPETLRALARLSLDYLQDAVTARDGLGRRAAPMRYQPWRVQPMPACETYRTRSRDGRARLTVIPACAVAVYAWDDGGLVEEDAP